MMRGRDEGGRTRDLTGRILVAEEKHAVRYFLVDTEEKLHAAALKLVTERLKHGWYYTPEKPTVDEGLLAMTPQEVAALKSEGVRKSTEAEMKHQRAALRDYERDLALHETIKKAVKERDGAVAWQVLRSRGDHEYEGYTFERLEGP